MQSYGEERYEAKKVSGSLRPVQITLDVQQHEENSNMTQYKGLYIDNVRTTDVYCPLKMLLPVRRPVKITLQNIYCKLQFFSNKQNGSWIDLLFGLFCFFLSTQEFFSSIDDFRSIHITPNHADQKKLSWNVHLDRSNGCPEVSSSFHQQALQTSCLFSLGSLFLGKVQFGCLIGAYLNVSLYYMSNFTQVD